MPIKGQQTSKANYFVLIFSKKQTKNLFNSDMIKGKNKVEKKTQFMEGLLKGISVNFFRSCAAYMRLKKCFWQPFLIFPNAKSWQIMNFMQTKKAHN